MVKNAELPKLFESSRFESSETGKVFRKAEAGSFFQ